jgi:hypothetical protein
MSLLSIKFRRDSMFSINGKIEASPNNKCMFNRRFKVAYHRNKKNHDGTIYKL